MNSDKTGELIRQLRKGKKWTQHELAKALHVSDKTVSKWERGRGCPDISIITDLAGLLEVDAAALLEGVQNINQKETGNMKRMRYYVCNECGNILTASGGRGVSCCGRPLAPLEPMVAQGAHLGEVEIIENDYFITFPHPMTKSHHLSFVAYGTWDKVLLMRLYPEQNPELRFPRMGKGELYCYCLEHGLFQQSL